MLVPYRDRIRALLRQASVQPTTLNLPLFFCPELRGIEVQSTAHLIIQNCQTSPVDFQSY
jgi:hypothetical protein